MRSFKELMVDASLSSTISPGWAVLLIIIYFGLWNASALTALKITVALEVIGNLFVLGVLLQVQSNLNRYWSSPGQNLICTGRRLNQFFDGRCRLNCRYGV